MHKWYIYIPFLFISVIITSLFYASITVDENASESLYEYYRETDMYEALISTGDYFTEYDLEAISAIDDVVDCRFFFDEEIPFSINQYNIYLRTFSLGNNNSLCKLVSGAYPDKDNECIIDNDLFSALGLSIGDSISCNPDFQFLDSILSFDTFIITGTCSSSLYLSYDRDLYENDEKCSGFIFINDNAYCCLPKNIVCNLNENTVYSDFEADLNLVEADCISFRYDMLTKNDKTLLADTENELLLSSDSEIELENEKDQKLDNLKTIWIEAVSIAEQASTDLEEQKTRLYKFGYNDENVNLILAAQITKLKELEDNVEKDKNNYYAAESEYNTKISELQDYISALKDKISGLNESINAVKIEEWSTISPETIKSFIEYNSSIIINADKTFTLRKYLNYSVIVFCVLFSVIGLIILSVYIEDNINNIKVLIIEFASGAAILLFTIFSGSIIGINLGTSLISKYIFRYLFANHIYIEFSNNSFRTFGVLIKTCLKNTLPYLICSISILIIGEIIICFMYKFKTKR